MSSSTARKIKDKVTDKCETLPCNVNPLGMLIGECVNIEGKTKGCNIILNRRKRKQSTLYAKEKTTN